MSTISVYTTCTNSIEDEYCVVESIKSALKIAREVIAVDGGSTDGTIDAIKSINDDRIKIVESKWLNKLGKNMHAINRSIGLGYCTSEWCMLLDSDEVIHEDDVEKIKYAINNVEYGIVALDCNTLHFYKNYKHLLNGYSGWKDLYTHKVYIVRNFLGVYHGNIGLEPDAHVDVDGYPISNKAIKHIDVNIYHYGHARGMNAYIRKQNKMREMFSNGKCNKIKEDEFHWIPEYKLTKFTGTHPEVISERILNGSN